MKKNISIISLIIVLFVTIVFGFMIMKELKQKEKAMLGLQKQLEQLENNDNLNNISANVVPKLRESKNDFIVYYDRSDCSDCDLFNPQLNIYLNENEVEGIYRVNLTPIRERLSDEDWVNYKKEIGIWQTPAFVAFTKGEIISVIEQKDEKSLTIDILNTWLLQKNIQQVLNNSLIYD